MTKRIALLSTLILSLVLLPGCPGAVSAFVGSWIITTSSNDWGLQINTNGEAIPFTVDLNLGGTWTWEVEGTRVVLHQAGGIGQNIWAAELTSETTMTGAWLSWEGQDYGNSNTFTAVKQ